MLAKKTPQMHIVLLWALTLVVWSVWRGAQVLFYALVIRQPKRPLLWENCSYSGMTHVTCTDGKLWPHARILAVNLSQLEKECVCVYVRLCVCVCVRVLSCVCVCVCNGVMPRNRAYMLALGGFWRSKIVWGGGGSSAEEEWKLRATQPL